MSHRDFDAAVDDLDGQAEGVTFTLFGREWAAAEITDSVRIRFAASGRESRAVIVDAMLDDLVVEGQREEWSRCLVEGRTATVVDEGSGEPSTLVWKPPKSEKMFEVITFLIAEHTGRPTMPSRPSSIGPGGTGDSSRGSTIGTLEEEPPSSSCRSDAA